MAVYGDLMPTSSYIHCAMCVEITVTVEHKQGDITDCLTLQRCCHSNRSQLPNFHDDCAQDRTQDQKQLETNLFTLPKGINKVLGDESNAENSAERTCTSLTLNVDPMSASCLTTELRRSTNFRNSFGSWMRLRTQMYGAPNSSRFPPCTEKGQDYGSASREERFHHIHLRLRLSRTQQYFRMEPDIRWSCRMLPQWILRAQMEDAFSCLSTLGGAYSSLGENMYNCAVEAGRVALRQLYLAECLGDALLKSRCLLYVALSLMQRGQLAKAKKLVRQQYKFATSKSACQDTRLVCMCQGIWHHLRHHYAKRRER